MVVKLNREEKAVIEPLVVQFLDRKTQQLLMRFQNSVVGAIEESDLSPLVHSVRSRIKDPDHLRDKLSRKYRKCREEGREFDITSDNLLTRITDLAGIRLLHLHTRQAEEINKHLKAIIAEQRLDLKEGPFARTWDDENRAFFKSIGFDTQESETMYTSVHYVVASNSQTTVTCEIQVRTLMEEVWGEVDHAINYPHPVDSIACREQIRALARATSTATRLVDSIFATVGELEQIRAINERKRGRTG